MINPLQAATVEGAAATPGHDLTVAYDRKMRAAARECRQQGIAFIPLVIESLGGWPEAAVKELRKLGAALGRLCMSKPEVWI